ncbi:gamma-glutamyltransferase [soil metagenome]
MSVLARGGNAVDAAIAANAVQGVVAPETCGVGGDLFALVFAPGWDRPLALNSSGRAGSGAEAASLRDRGLDSVPQRHPAAVTVPGCVDGWLTLHSELGVMTLANVLEPAIAVAEGGFPASREFTHAFASRADELREEPSATDMYPSGTPPVEGGRHTRRRLAQTLRAVIEGGRDAFYAGAVGAAISGATNGLITAGDLEVSQAEWVTPLAAELFGSRGWTMPPNSQGYIVLSALAAVERIGLGDPEDPATWHLIVESYRLAAADRDLRLAEPSGMDVEATELVSKRRIDELAAAFDPDHVRSLGTPREASGGTAYLCCVDANGMGVSLIQSNFHGIGSGRSVGEAGFLLNDRGRGFTLTPGHPNELAPGRRPLHTLAPTIWTSGTGLEMVLGTRGGHQQPQLVIQLATRIAGHRLEPAIAMTMPRWTMENPRPGDMVSRLEVEPGTPPAVVEGLAARGHQVSQLEYPQVGWGPMSAICVDGDGLRIACADPRVDTATSAAT